MHVVQIPTDIDAGPQGIWPKGRYVMEDRNAAEMILLHPNAGISCESYPVKPIIGANGSKNIVVAGGLGMGDAIMLTPVLRELHAQGITVRVACFHHYRDALLNLPYLDGFEEWPLRTDAGGFENVIFLENFLNHPSARTAHLSDVFAEICGINLIDHNADYIPTEAELYHATEAFPRVKGRKRLAMQVKASHLCRTYPFSMLRDLMQMMILKGWEVYLVGGPGEYNCGPEAGHLYDARNKAPGFRESCAFLTTCDAFVGPDSGFLHAAGAMEIPSVGLFSVFPWKLRTAYYPKTFAIQGVGECSPCFHSPTKLQPAFPRTGPCAVSFRCDVLATIEPEKIKAKLLQIAR